MYDIHLNGMTHKFTCGNCKENEAIAFMPVELELIGIVYIPACRVCMPKLRGTDAPEMLILGDGSWTDKYYLEDDDDN